jgi:hypothetical protein
VLSDSEFAMYRHRMVSDECKALNVPSPQDWALVLERVKP